MVSTVGASGINIIEVRAAFEFGFIKQQRQKKCKKIVFPINKGQIFSDLTAPHHLTEP